MAAVTDEVIAANLRIARENRGLTLEQLAAASDLSKAHLSRLEAGERSPSIAALLKLAAVLGVRVSGLLGEDPGGAPISLHGPDEVRHDSGGLAIASCSGFAGSRVLEALRVTVNPDRPATVPGRHRGEEWIYVLSGSLDLEYAGELHEIPAGTSAHFDADRPHRMSVREGHPAEVLVVSAQEGADLRTVHH
ncbi:MAG TPA: helix-turn-helix domain-containing protein [Pseudonocardia sp.]|jgi:transcriptional regulator with XRE-family HTH domain